MSQRFTPLAEKILTVAQNIAISDGSPNVGSEHILLGILTCKDSVAHHLLHSVGITQEQVKEKIQSFSSTASARPTVFTTEMTPVVREIISNAKNSAADGNVGSQHILLAMIDSNACLATHILEDLGTPMSALRKNINRFNSTSPTEIHKQDDDVSISALSKYGKDLTNSHAENSVLIGREDEMNRIIQILCRKSKNNPCLIGEAGVGKTAIVEGLAKRISANNVPDILRHKKIISLDFTQIISGAKYRGEFEERMRDILSEALNNKDIILFIDEIHVVMGAGSAEGAMDAANILKPPLSRGEIQIIGATTIDEYRKHIERDQALQRRFQSVMINEPGRKETLNILMGLKNGFEQHHKVKISNQALEYALDMSMRYINDRFLPDKAIDVLDEACSALRLKIASTTNNTEKLKNQIDKLQIQKKQAILNFDMERANTIHTEEQHLCDVLKTEIQNQSKNIEKLPILHGSDIAKIITKQTGIPVSRIMKPDSQKLLDMSSELSSKIIGQDKAIGELSRAIRRGRTGLKNPSRPIGSFIFAGATGVGKTYLCKMLAQCLFGSENALIRLDMSEYMEKHSVSKLIGSPPGYVGYGESGFLTEKVRRSPYSIILFDEIEKAHPDVLNILLQVLDDGILTDSCGRKVNFKNTVIIMTSNVGANTHTSKPLGFFANDSSKYDEEERHTLSEIKKTFSPEFINRVDNIIVFRQLDINDLEKITALCFAQLQKHLKSMKISFDFDTEACKYIAKLAIAENLGARPVKRYVTKFAEDKISEMLLRGIVKPGSSLHATVLNNNIVLNVL